MYKIMFVDGSVKCINKSMYRGFFLANRERIRGVVSVGGAK